MKVVALCPELTPTIVARTLPLLLLFDFGLDQGAPNFHAL